LEPAELTRVAVGTDSLRGNMPFKGVPEHGHVGVAGHTAELLAGLDHAGGAPALCHLPVSPALDVAGVVAADRDHRLDRVGRPQRPARVGGTPSRSTVNVSAMPSRRLPAAPGWGLVQRLGQRFRQRLGFERGESAW